MNETAHRTPFEAIADLLLSDRHGLEDLSEADRHLAQIGCLLVVGPTSPELRALFDEALQQGSSAACLESVLIHAAGYLGFISTRRSYELLEDVRRTRVDAEARHVDGAIETDRQSRVEDGARLYDRFDPGRQAQQAKKFEALSSAYYPRAMELSGLVLAPPLLRLRERQIVTVALLSCLGGQADQLRFHIGVALRNDVGRKTLAGILILVQGFAGMPRANSAAGLAIDVLGEASGSDSP